MAKKPIQRIPMALEAAQRAVRAGDANAAIRLLGSIRDDAQGVRAFWELTADAQSILGRKPEAADAIERAVALAPKRVDTLVGAGWYLRSAGRYDLSLERLERAAAIDPKNFEARRTVATILIDLGRKGDAVEVLRAVERDFASAPPRQRLSIASGYASAAPDAIDAGEAIAKLAPLAATAEAPVGLMCVVWHNLGRLYEHAGEFDAAFDAYARMNELSKTEWDADMHARRFDELIEAWTNNPTLPQAAADGSRFVFIVGMMRSGTSLAEQMLAQLDGVTPGGEMNVLSRAVHRFEASPKRFLRPLPIRMANASAADSARVARTLQEGFAAAALGGFLTDKQPFNFMYAPMIARLLPGAKIIHCVRDPVDICLSNFTQNFSRPHPYTTDLAWLGRFYRDYERMMAAWNGLDGLDIIELRYEDVVADAEATMRPVVERLGLEWSDRLLEFHKDERTITTSSRDQVRRKLYKSSVNRADRFGAALEPLREALRGD